MEAILATGVVKWFNVISGYALVTLDHLEKILDTVRLAPSAGDL